LPGDCHLEFSMPNLILIRHSNSKLDPDLPPHQWGLTEEGRRRCLPLAEQLRPYAPEVIVTSKEPKAIQTGQIVAETFGGLPCHATEGLHEHRREHGPIVGADQFRERVFNLFARPDLLIFGLETAHEALDRFTGAVESVLVNHPNKNIAIVSHGTVMSLYYGQITGENAYAFWQALGLPAFYVVTLPEYRLLSVAMQIETS
jgi:broad specificity phosphatase PhoE